LESAQEMAKHKTLLLQLLVKTSLAKIIKECLKMVSHTTGKHLLNEWLT
jgi:hypothetical protein